MKNEYEPSALFISNSHEAHRCPVRRCDALASARYPFASLVSQDMLVPPDDTGVVVPGAVSDVFFTRLNGE
ncbi:MAG: hypothetical protein V7640_3405 [Betaproteobacteria bacterium]